MYRLFHGSVGPVGDNLKKIWAGRRHLLFPVLVFEAWFTILAVSVALPAIAWLMNRLVNAGGGVAIGNTEMVGFFLSVPGLIFLVVAISSAVTLQYAEYACLLVILRAWSAGRSAEIRERVWGNLIHLPQLIQLGLIQTLVYGIGMLPWLGGCLWIKSHWLGAHDINYYLSRTPSEWYVALATVAVWTFPWLIAGIALFVRWLHAVPLIVLEQQSARGALAVSWRRSKGAVWRGVGVLLVWNLVVLAGSLLIGSGIRWLTANLLGSSLGSLEWTLAIVLTALAAMGLSGLVGLAVGKTGLAMLVLATYETEAPTDAGGTVARLPAWLDRLRPRSARMTAWSLILILLNSGGFWVRDFITEIKPPAPPLITAHRGSSHAAPENSLSALRRAIEDGADCAEIDVQRTADGAVVLHHDGDFMRVSGDARQVWDLTLDEMRQLDVGAWFSEAYTGERITTLEEAIEVCRGRLRLNIELKYNREDPQLAMSVGEILRREDFADQCIVMSLNWGPLGEFASGFPEVPIGLIVFRSLGRVENVDADAFSMNAGQMTSGLIRSIHRRDAQVHVWTVNDDRMALRMIEMGVDNLITDRPESMRRLVDNWETLENPEKVALQLRRLILPGEELPAAEL